MIYKTVIFAPTLLHTFLLTGGCEDEGLLHVLSHDDDLDRDVLDTAERKSRRPIETRVTFVRVRVL